MNHLDIALAARAFAAGRGVRSRILRHRHLVSKPIAVVLWQLGAEPFTAAAIGWGDSHAAPYMAVAGEPRNRDLAFAALLEFARWFNPRFESHADSRETLQRRNYTFTVARTAPQVVVANGATIELMRRLGRRLAYLPIEGRWAADPALVRLGRHLLFLSDRSAFPGQQLVVALTDLMNDHWATPQSVLERQSLPALEAFVDPPHGTSGFDAASEAERFPVGPLPDAEDEQELSPLVERFNESRNGKTDPSVVDPLLAPIRGHYCPLLRRTWDLLWRSRDREASIPEAFSAGRRWDADRDAYTRHVDWLNRNGLRRTRQTPRQAATTLRDLEEAGRLVEAEEACDDPLQMAAYVLANQAVRGSVVGIDRSHREPGPKRMVSRPLVTIRSPDPCSIPVGRELWWTRRPSGKEFVIEQVRPVAGNGSEVVLKLMTSSETELPTLGDVACFSIHSTTPVWLGNLPKEDPWTHLAAEPEFPPSPIEDAYH